MSSSNYLDRNYRGVGDRIMTEGDYQSGATAAAGVGLIVLLSGFLNSAFPVHRMVRQMMGLLSGSISFCACALAFADTANTLEPQWVILCYALFALLALLVWLITFYLTAFILCLAIAFPAYQIDWSAGMMVLFFLMSARPMIAAYKEKRWTGFTALACVVGLSVACFCAAIGTRLTSHQMIAQTAIATRAISNSEVRAVSPPTSRIASYTQTPPTKVNYLGEQTDASKETELGVQYLNGEGVSKDFAIARVHFIKAGHEPRALTNLGWMEALGQGMARDDAQAIVFFTEAANVGFPPAEDSLGFMYEHGRGVARDLDTAASWYRKGADAGFKKSVENLQRLAQQFQ
jgi:hypothetical protein